MAGTGSDADYVVRAFGPAARQAGRELVAPAAGADLVDDYVRALDAAADEYGPILVGGGPSAPASPPRGPLAPVRAGCAGVWAALPRGPGRRPAVLRRPRRHRRCDGARRTRPPSRPWLLAARDGWPTSWTRSWTALYPGVIGQLRAAAGLVGPDLHYWPGWLLPLAVVVSDDDPIHRPR